MTLQLEKFEEIRRDEENLNKFIDMLEHGYSFLSAECKHALGGFEGDDEDEEDDDSEVDPDMDLPTDDSRKDLTVREKIDITSFDEDDGEYFETQEQDEPVTFNPNNPNEPEKRKERKEIAIKELWRMIKQLSHPDKIMRFSAETKKQILAIFHESTEFHEDENVEGMVFSYVKLLILRGEPDKIPDYIEQHVNDRHRQIIRHMSHLMAKPFTPAILRWQEGDIKMAVRMFRQYLLEEELRKSMEQTDEEYFKS